MIRFAHNYYKLENDKFTTIRGVKYLEQKGKKVGDTFKIITPKGEFDCILEKIEYRKICNLPLNMLKNDGEYDGFEIKSHQEFVNLLNSFTPYKNNRLETKKLILYLKKINGD